ncbi:MAG: hypothetical protein JWN86_1240 [Planctomycetota bacterium]|nr:hypothetical protein [Planctomycetota bacterium]
MWSLVLCALAIGQAPATAPDPVPIPSGTWSLMANGQVGELITEASKGNSIHGEIFNQLFSGTYDPKTKHVEMRRRVVKSNGDSYEVQVYKGELAEVKETKPTSYILRGTFRSVAGSDWGDPDVDYAWRADSIPATNRGEELKELQGRWEVLESQNSSAGRKMPAETHLGEHGAKFTINGNELIWDGHVVAVLANDLFMPDAAKDVSPVRRHPLMLTLPSGKGVLCSYILRKDSMEIVYPHTIGRVGSGQFIWLKRAAK